MKTTFTAVLFTAIAFWALSVSAETPRFEIRGSHWGDTVERVRQQESGIFLHETDEGAMKVLVYRAPYLGEDVSVIYRFIDGKLFQVMYSFESKGRKCDALKDRFDASRQDLTTSFGEQVALSEAGDRCNQSAKWEQPGTNVVLHLSTNSGRSDLQIAYESSHLAELSTHTGFLVPPTTNVK